MRSQRRRLQWTQNYHAPEDTLITIQRDVAVVGGSWAGLAAATQLARARRSVRVIDSGLPRNRFAAAAHGFFGHDGRRPDDILDDAREQFLSYPTAEFHIDHVANGRSCQGIFELTTTSGTVVEARRLILATGVDDILPDIPGLWERWGITVVHCPYCHGFELADRPVGVIASSETAVHQAMLLRDWATDITLFTEGRLTLDDKQRGMLRWKNVRVETRAIEALLGDAPELTGVRLVDGDTVAIGALYVAAHTQPSSSLARELGCAIDEGLSGPFIRTDERKETTVAGVFAAGDTARSMSNVTWAVADGMAAGVFAHQSLVFDGVPAE